MSSKSEFTVEGVYSYNRRSVPRWIVSHVWRYKKFLFLSFGLYVISIIAYSLSPVFTGRAATILRFWFGAGEA